jgi:soluble lytic murein transglycosylase-like protein
MVIVPYEAAFRWCALKWGVPASLMMGMASQASGFDANAMGPTDDRGLMQVICSNAVNPPGCATTPAGLFDPTTNLCCAASLLRKHFDRLRPYAASRSDLWKLVMLANNMGYGFVSSHLPASPVTWEAMKAATPNHGSKHLWIERMAGPAEAYHMRDLLLGGGLLLTLGTLAYFAFIK